MATPLNLSPTAPSDNVQPGSSLNFGFTSADTPASVNGDSVFYPGTPVGTSFVYSGGPFQGDSGTNLSWHAAPTLQSIAVTPANTSLPTGETEQFTATGTLSNDIHREPDQPGDLDLLRHHLGHDQQRPGWPRPSSPGPVTISAAFDGITGSTGLTVTAAALQSIAVTPANTSLPTGETEQFTATGTLSDNSTENLTSQVTWASSDTTWATINSDRAGDGRVARPRDDLGGLRWHHRLDRADGDRRATLQSIAVTPANTSLPTGETEQFTATGTLSDNTTENLTSQVTWASSDTTWATINATGLATAVSPGPVTISATFDGITGSTGLTVTAAVLQSIAVTPANTSLPTGETEQFTATGTLSDNIHREPDQPGDLGLLRHHLGHDQHAPGWPRPCRQAP